MLGDGPGGDQAQKKTLGLDRRSFYSFGIEQQKQHPPVDRNQTPCVDPRKSDGELGWVPIFPGTINGASSRQPATDVASRLSAAQVRNKFWIPHVVVCRVLSPGW